MIRLMIVDDDTLVRRYLKRIIIEQADDIEIVCEAIHGAHALTQYSEFLPDIILMDVNMPVMNGIECIKSLNNLGQSVGVIVLSCLDDFEYVLESMKRGAADYILKHSFSPSELIELIRNTYAGMQQTLDIPLAPQFKLVDKVSHQDVQTVLSYINSNYTQPLSLTALAHRASLSKSYLSQLFKSKTGYNITQYITMMRIEKSKRLLVESDFLVYEVAQQAGFDNQYYFIRAFKKAVGVTPEVYRKQSISDE